MGWVSGSLGAGQGDFPCAGELGDSKALHEADEFLDFAFVTGDFDGEFPGLNIHNFSAENIANLHDFTAVFRGGFHAEHDEFAVHVLVIAKIGDLDDVHQFVELLGHLLEHGVVAAHDDGHAGSGGIHRGTDVQRINVEAASAEHSGDAREHTGTVFHKGGDRVTHRNFGLRKDELWG